MNAFLYPSDLLKICKEAWQREQRRMHPPEKPTPAEPRPRNDKKDCPPFPSDEHLLELLETVYHLSFLAEEGRRVAVRVIYVLPKTFELCNQLNLPPRAARFQRAATLSVGELLKLAPAVQATESAIMVAPATSMKDGSGKSLVIWGVLHLGTEWWKVLTGADSGAVCPPNCLTISSFAPGNITISTLGFAIARLRNGQLIGTPLPDLDEGPIGSFLNSTAQELYRDTAKALGRKKYSRDSDSDLHPMQLYYRTLARLLHLIREQRHGGTLLVLPDELSPEDGRLADRVSIKYHIEIPPVWKTLIDEGVANSHYYSLLFSNSHKYLPHDKKAPASKLREVINWEKNFEGARKRIAEFCSFVAALSAVDGAVVMTKKLRIIGFGAEIIATSPSLTAVREALDPALAKTALIPIERFGTRHRSAMRMCSSFEDCIALVVSQDGPVKAMKRVGADVVMWNDVTLGRLAI